MILPINILLMQVLWGIDVHARTPGSPGPRHHPVLLGLVSVVVIRSAFGLSLDGYRVVEGVDGSSDF